MGFNIFDRIQARIGRFRQEQRHSRKNTYNEPVFANASHADLPPPPRRPFAEAARPRSAGDTRLSFANDPVLPPSPGFSEHPRSSGDGYLSPTWGPSSSPSLGTAAANSRPQRASRWSIVPGFAGLTKASSASTHGSNDYAHERDAEDPTAADIKRNRRKTMMQRMSVMHENPTWRGTMTPEQMQDWRIHAIAVQ